MSKIKPTIDGLIKAGVLIKTQSPCISPIFPIKKPHSNDYRLVHDRRIVNAEVDADPPVVPDPHTLLSNISSDIKWYTSIDLCSSFLFRFNTQSCLYIVGEQDSIKVLQTPAEGGHKVSKDKLHFCQ